MKKLILFCTFVLSSVSMTLAPAQAQGESYGVLAQSTMMDRVQKLNSELETVSASLLPHQAKNLRKRLGDLREALDIFSYAYASEETYDFWREIRNELDSGYEIVGSFKDLYDIQETQYPVYDRKQVNELREEVINWANSWRLRDDYTSFLLNPSLTSIYSRPKNELSKFYWGSSIVEPSLRYSGVQNLAFLANDLTVQAMQDWKKIKRIDSISKYEHSLVFHDFRKRLRALTSLLKDFPEVYLAGDANTLDRMVLLVSRYGKINDVITKLSYAKWKDRLALKERIDREWTILLEEQKRDNIPAQLEVIYSGIIKP